MWALDRPRKHERDAVYYDDYEEWRRCEGQKRSKPKIIDHRINR